MALLRRILLSLLVLPLFVSVASAQSNYLVQPGDTLQLEVLEDSSLNRDLLVLPDGRVTVPFVGSIRASGRTLSQVQASVRAGLAPSFAEPPTVFVSLRALNVPDPEEPEDPVTIDVYVIGEVDEPGRREIKPGTTLLQFFAEMGGFSRFAALGRVQLRTSRSGREVVYVLDYNAIERGSVVGTSTVLADGDVIVVPQRRLFE